MQFYKALFHGLSDQVLTAALEGKYLFPCFSGVLFSRAALTNYHKRGDLKQQKSILSYFWRPEFQTHGVSRVMLPPKA